MTPNTPLRSAVFNSGQQQQVIAKRAHLHETRLSKLARGHVAPTEAEAKALARVLKTSPHALFPDQFPEDEAVA